MLRELKMTASRMSSLRSLLRNPKFVATIVFILALISTASLIWTLERRRRQVAQAQIANIASQHAHELQVNIERALSATYVLDALVRQGNGTIANFNEIATHMLSYYPSVSSLSLSPGGIVQQVVPLAGNEKSIGFDVFLNAAQDKEALIALQSKKLTFAGPLDQVQGGLAAYGRLPIFLDDSKEASVFWGFVSVGMLFPQALAQVRGAQPQYPPQASLEFLLAGGSHQLRSRSPFRCDHEWYPRAK
jgi:sensor domain CHASE-containing protein